MDFTREPIIETVITPKEGCKLVVRSSKTTGQEEYFVDAVEVVSFGTAIFFRSLERPKSFIVPASDYEILEVREARIVLKNVGLDRSIKIGGGREAAVKVQREAQSEQQAEKESAGAPAEAVSPKIEGRVERKRDRRRQYRKKRGRDEAHPIAEEPKDSSKLGLEEKVELAAPEKEGGEGEISESVNVTGTLLSSLLTPPPLISETISRYKEKFRDAFYTKEEQEARMASEEGEEAQLPGVAIEQPAFGSFEMSEEDEEEIYRQRKRRIFLEEEEDENAPKEFFESVPGSESAETPQIEPPRHEQIAAPEETPAPPKEEL